MKKFTSTIVAAAAFTLPAFAQQDRVTVSGVFVLSDGTTTEKVHLVGASPTAIEYVNKLQAVKVKKKPRSAVKSIYIKEPAAYTKALELYEDRKYGEANKQFGVLKESYKKLESLPGNHATLSGFYELECLRKQLKLGELGQKLATFQTDALLSPEKLQQVALYKFWEAVQNKSWDTIDKLAKEWEPKRIPVSQRAQIAYCHGLALENLKRPLEAIEAYSTAMTADYMKSEVISREAAQNALRVYATLPGVKEAKAQWGKEGENLGSSGRQLLLEANGLARFYEKAGVGAGASLPAAAAEFLKYTPEKAK